MRSPTSLIVLAAFAGMAGGLDRPASAQADTPWKVEGKLLGKDQKKSKDVSGIACLPGGAARKCLVIDDEVQFAQVVIVEDGSLVAGDTIRLVDPENGKWNIDGEGVAFSDGGPSKPDYFYIVGSHGHPRDRDGKLDALDDAGEIKARFDASSVLIRLQIDPGSIGSEGKAKKPPKGETLVDLRPIIYEEPSLAPLRPFLGRRLEEKRRGLTIEGIAAVHGRLYVGLRAPTLAADLSVRVPSTEEERAVVISFDRDAPFDRTPPNAQLSLLPLGQKRGVRDLAAHGSDILVLAGPAYEPNTAEAAGKPGEYAIYLWDRSNETRKLKDLPPYGEDGKALKPEALLPLRTNSDGTVDVLVLFDGATEGGPRQVTLPRP